MSAVLDRNVVGSILRRSWSFYSVFKHAEWVSIENESDQVS
jgi:hypothetical protein